MPGLSKKNGWLRHSSADGLKAGLIDVIRLIKSYAFYLLYYLFKYKIF